MQFSGMHTLSQEDGLERRTGHCHSVVRTRLHPYTGRERLSVADATLGQDIIRK